MRLVLFVLMYFLVILQAFVRCVCIVACCERKTRKRKKLFSDKAPHNSPHCLFTFAHLATAEIQPSPSEQKVLGPEASVGLKTFRSLGILMLHIDGRV